MIFNETSGNNMQRPLFIARNIDEYLAFCNIVGNKDPIVASEGLELYRQSVQRECRLSEDEERTLNNINNAINNGTFLHEATINTYKKFLENLSMKLQRNTDELAIIGESNWNANIEISNAKRLYKELNSLSEKNRGLGGVVEVNKKLALKNIRNSNDKIEYKPKYYKSITGIEIIPVGYNSKYCNRYYDSIHILEELRNQNSDFILDDYFDIKKTAELHGFITSPTRGRFRIKLLHQLQERMSLEEIKKLCQDENLKEYGRHIHKLLEFGLIEQLNGDEFIRNKLGEDIINSMRALERKIGKENVKKIFNASIDIDSEKLFLILYLRKKDVDLLVKDIKYSPSEIKELCLNVFNPIELMSSLNRLEKGELLVRRNDGNFHMDPTKAFGFYSYLTELRKLIGYNNHRQ